MIDALMTTLLILTRLLQPSIQKLVGSLATDCLIHLTEEVVRTDAFTEAVPGVNAALLDLKSELSSAIDQDLLAEALQKAGIRAVKRKEKYDQTVRKAPEDYATFVYIMSLVGVIHS